MIVVGLVILATCLVAKPTPEGRGKGVRMSWSERPGTRYSDQLLDQNVGKGEEAGENLQKTLCGCFVIQFFLLALCSKETLLIPRDMRNLTDKRASQQSVAELRAE